MKTNIVKIKTKSSSIELSEREQLVLKAIVHLHILTAQPIGSRLVAKYLEKKLNLSPATIRNVMFELEEMELLEQTHISSGRIPTDKGYRVYINALLPQVKPSARELKKIQEELQKTEVTSIEDTLKTASKILGHLSKYLSIIIIPSIQDITVEKIDIVQLSTKRLLFVLALNSNFVETLTIETDIEINKEQIESVVGILNEKIAGKSLKFINENFTNLIETFESKELPIFHIFINFFDKIYNTLMEQERTMISGIKYLLQYPEFQEPEHIKKIISLLENSELILNILPLFEEDKNLNVKVLIGSEIHNELFCNYSLVASPYWITNSVGYIGLLGPKRMHYPKVIRLVNAISKVISQNLAQSSWLEGM